MSAPAQLIRQLFNLIGDIRQRLSSRRGVQIPERSHFANALRCARNQCCLAREDLPIFNVLLNMESYTPLTLKIQ